MNYMECKLSTHIKFMLPNLPKSLHMPKSILSHGPETHTSIYNVSWERKELFTDVREVRQTEIFQGKQTWS